MNRDERRALLMSEDPIERLLGKHTPDPVPPCRVCGGELGISSMGGGHATKFNCSNADTLKYRWGTPEQKEASEHYRNSEYYEIFEGDRDVLELVRQIQQIKALCASATQLQADGEGIGTVWLADLRAILSTEASTPEERNPHLPLPPEDGQHVYWDGPSDIGGNHRCKLCGAYRGSVESTHPCLGEYKESGKLRSWAKHKWDEERAAHAQH